MSFPEAALPFDADALGYTLNNLDRRANDREHPAVIPALLDQATTRTLVLNRDQVLLRSEAPADPWFALEEARVLGDAVETIFLGEGPEGGRFAMLLDLPSEQSEGVPPVADLRGLASSGGAPAEWLGIMAQAKAALHWHRSHRFCSACGARTAAAAAGWRRECLDCGTHHFPRTDPVVIMLAIDGDRCLMGRQARFVPGMYSCLAGFLEPGETIEAAVRRELQEESGVRVGEVRYLGSQPWPFPASLMIGCWAAATNATLTVDHAELEDARWFTRAEVLQMLAGTHPDGLKCPQPMAIAHGLIRAWAGDPR